MIDKVVHIQNILKHTELLNTRRCKIKRHQLGDNLWGDVTSRVIAKDFKHTDISYLHYIKQYPNELDSKAMPSESKKQEILLLLEVSKMVKWQFYDSYETQYVYQMWKFQLFCWILCFLITIKRIHVCNRIVLFCSCRKCRILAVG